MWTIDDYNALTKAIGLGALTVKHGDQEVTYRSLKEMLSIKAQMEVQLNLRDKNSGRKFASHTKGIE